MIGADVNAARAIIADLSGLCDFNTLGSDAVSLCAKLQSRLSPTHLTFRGALVPEMPRSGRQSSDTCRRLDNERVAATNASASSFRWSHAHLVQWPTGPQAPPADLDPAALRCDRAVRNPCRLAVMRLPPDPKNRIAALRAIVRARDTLARAPDLQRSVPEPTSWLLTRFQDCLNVGRRDAATDVLARLRAELRLDALNLKFLEVQLLAAFGDWTGIIDLPGFANLCLARSNRRRYRIASRGDLLGYI